MCDEEEDEEERQPQSESKPPSKPLKATHIWSAVSRLLRWKEAEEQADEAPSIINLEDEYQKACRTESYVEFSQRVALARSSGSANASGSISPKPRSFELLAASLLEPAEEQVLAILMSNSELRNKPEIFELVRDYFEESKKSSTLCTLLLKSIERSRERCKGIRGILGGGGDQGSMSDGQIVQKVCSGLDVENMFSGEVLQQFQPVHDHYLGMQKRLEKIRKITGAKLRNGRKCLKAMRVILSTGCFFLLLLTTLAAFLAVAALVVGWKVFTLPINYVVRKLSRRRKHRLVDLEKQWRQIEAVAQGTFVVVQDLDTMKRLVMRLGCEIEFTNRTLAFCLKHKEDKLILRESLQRLSRNQIVLGQLLDDLEENIYLSFMSINKARSLVVRELCLH